VAPASASVEAPLASVSASASAFVAAPASASGAVDAGPVIGDQRIYSIAIETYVRALPERKARAIGYLRAGASSRRSDEPVGKSGCKDGWYAVEPEGFVCNGPDATLEPAAKILTYAVPGPKRGEPVPYQYASVRGKVPHYYARLPEKKDRMRIEGGDVEGVIVGAYHSPDPNLGLLGPAREVPQELLEGGRVPRPPGAAPRLRYKFHTGRAEPKTRLALMSWFEHDKRRWAVTSQLDLVAIDRLRIIEPPPFHGVELEEGQSLPVGFLRVQTASGYRFDDDGKVTETVRLKHRQPFRLNGEKKVHAGKTVLGSHEGIWVQESLLTMVEPRDVPTFVKNDTLRWLDISVRDQTLVAYRGNQPVYVTLVSTGSGGMGDPETTHSTPRGLFAIFSKHVSTKMSGDEIGSEYLIDDVPYVQYFHHGYALHGAFWHDNFGRVQSHGCVNLAPADAAWVFEFTGPEVPEGWHGRYVKSGGTPVLIRP
jgi:lipoprotein-anchoring transpeptidase ErfK/SrfK